MPYCQFLSYIYDNFSIFLYSAYFLFKVTKDDTMANRNETSKFREMSKLTKFAFWLSAMSPLLVSWSITLCYQNRDYLMWGGVNLKSIGIFCAKFLLPIVFIIFSVMGYYLLKLSISRFQQGKICNSECLSVSNISNNNKELIGFILAFILPFFVNEIIYILGIILFFCIIYVIYTDSEYLIYNPILKLCCHYSIYKCSIKGLDTNLICTDDIELEENKEYSLYNIGRNVYFI